MSNVHSVLNKVTQNVCNVPIEVNRYVFIVLIEVTSSAHSVLTEVTQNVCSVLIEVNRCVHCFD